MLQIRNVISNDKDNGKGLIVREYRQYRGYNKRLNRLNNIFAINVLDRMRLGLNKKRPVLDKRYMLNSIE